MPPSGRLAVACWAAAVVSKASALALHGKDGQHGANCLAEDLQRRTVIQSHLTGVVEEMCRELEVKNPAQCKATEKGVESGGAVIKTWEQLILYMDDVSEAGRQMIKGWMEKNGKASVMQLASTRTISVAAGKVVDASSACAAADLEHRSAFQAKLRGMCVDMCATLGTKQCQCPGASEQEAVVGPSVMTWVQLIAHMDDLSAWGLEVVKGWHAAASQLQVKQTDATVTTEDLRRRAQVQNKLAGVCSDMCAKLAADQEECSRKCANFVTPDSSPGVMTWEELMQHMDNLVGWGADEVKGWHAQRAGAL